MKKKLLPLTFTVATLMSLGTATAAPYSVDLKDIGPTEGTRITYGQDKTRRLEAGEMVDVTVVVEMSLDEYRFDSYFMPLAIGAQGYCWIEDFSANPAKTKFTAHAMLPEGKFDFIASFMHVNTAYNKGYDHLAWIIQEQVEVEAGSVITIKPSLATNHIKYETFNPNGDPTQMKVLRYIDEDYHAEVVDEGNVSMMTIANTLTSKDYGLIDYLCRDAAVFEPSEAVPYIQNGVSYMDVYVNDVSDNYEFRQVRLMNGEDDQIYTVALNHYGSPVGETTISNNSEDYFIVDNSYAASWVDDLSADTYEKKYTVYFGATETAGRLPEGQLVGHTHRDTPFNSVYACIGNGNEEEPLAVLMFERTVTDTNEDESYYDESPWLYLSNSEQSWYATFTEEPLSLGEGGKYGKWFPGHPGLGYTINELDGGFLSTSPVITMAYTEDWNSRNQRDLMLFSYRLSSQANEDRGTDALHSTFSLKYNGEEVLDGDDLEWGWPYSWVKNDHAPGEYVLSIVDEAFSFNGTAVRTEAEMRFDNSQTDYSAPVLQGFQIRDTNGVFVSNLQNASDGELRIVGGDFNMNKSTPYPDGYYDVWYDIAPANLDIEYAIHGSDDFQPLEGALEVDETYWGFGQYWRVPLAGMTVNEANKWYDIRVTLSDESGNYQRHLFSPAFHIDMPTEIPSLDADEVAIEFEGDNLIVSGNGEYEISLYSLNGGILAQGYGDRLAIPALEHGIYFVRVSGSSVSQTFKIVK